MPPRLNWKPVALVYPTDANGVSAAVKCGAANGVKVNARSGGHSCEHFSNPPVIHTRRTITQLSTDAAFALGGEDGHLTVSLDHLRHLSLHGDEVTFGTGNRLGDVALYLWENGASAPPWLRARGAPAPKRRPEL